jgi:hypothetical protein
MKVLRLEELTTLPEIRELTPEVLAEALRLAKQAFTADDLQKFTEIEPGTDMAEFLTELEQ